jgi:Fe2+ transport system protein B
MNVFNIAGLFLIGFIIVFIITALLTKSSESEEASTMIWRPSMMKLPRELVTINRIWYRNLFFWGSVMVALYVLIYIIFW